MSDLRRVIKGSSWYNFGWNFRSANRNWDRSHRSDEITGFRVVSTEKGAEPNDTIEKDAGRESSGVGDLDHSFSG